MHRPNLGASRPRSIALRALVLLLLPILILSNPTSAAAGTITYGDAVPGEIRLDPQTETADIFCRVSAFWMLDGTIQSTRGAVTCSGNWAVSDLVLDSWTFSGPGCSMTGGSTEQLDGTQISLNILTEGVVAPCIVTTACLSATYRLHTMPPWNDSETADGCLPLAVGGPESVETGSGAGECGPGGGIQVERPTVARSLWYGTYDGYSTRYTWQQQYRFRINDTTAGAHWRRYIITRGPTGELISGPLAGSLTGDINLGSALGSDISVAGVWSEPLSTQRMASWRSGSSAPGPANQTVIGIGYFRGGKGLAWGDYAALPQSKATGILGVTDPARCAFYWGEKIADLPLNTFDEPLGGVEAGPTTPPGSETEPVTDPTPLPDGDSCSFAVTDPSTWFCGIADLVMMLFDAIAGIPGAILDGLQALFVPDLDGIKAAFGDVQDAFADTYPGAWVEALADFSVPSGGASGCAGPSVDVPLGEGLRFQAEPLNACSGTAAELAALCKLIVTVTVGFFGGLACIRAVGSGFNWNPGGGGA